MLMVCESKASLDLASRSESIKVMHARACDALMMHVRTGSEGVIPYYTVILYRNTVYSVTYTAVVAHALMNYQNFIEDLNTVGSSQQR